MKDKPLKLIRLVIQLADTKINRKVMDRLHAEARKCSVQPPWGSIKREDTKIISLTVTNIKDTP